MKKIIHSAALVIFTLYMTSCSTMNGAESPSISSTFEMRLVKESVDDADKIHSIKGEDSKPTLENDILISGRDIKKVYIVNDEYGGYAVAINLNIEGSEKFSAITKNYLNRRLAILVNGKVITAPVIKNHINDGKIMISGNFTRDDAEYIVKSIKGTN